DGGRGRGAGGAYGGAHDAPERGRAFAGGARDGVQLDAARGEGAAGGGEARARLGQIVLAGDHDLRLLGELGARQRELAVQRLEVGERIPAGLARVVEQVDEDCGAREVAEDARAAAGPGGRALVQAW